MTTFFTFINLIKLVTLKIIKHLSILILILLPNIPCVSQFYYLESEQRIQNQILDLNYDNILPVETNLPNGIRFWLQGYQAFVCQLTSSVKRSTDSTLKVIQKMEQQIRALDSKSPYYNYCIADLNLMQSYLYLRENNPFYSARTFWKARNHYLLNIEKYPDFLPNQKHQLIDIAVIEWLNDMFVYSTKKNNNPSNELLLTNFWQDLLEKASKEETLLREVKILGYLIDASFKGNYNLVDVKKKGCY